MFNIKIYRILAAVALIGWMGFIFSMSDQTAETSSDMSGSLIEWFLNAFYPNFKELSAASAEKLISQLQFFVRKGAHFGAYGVLGIIAMLNVMPIVKFRLSLSAVMSQLFCLLYAVSDEIHQLYIPGRSGEIRDVLIDFFGALVGIGFLSLLVILYNGYSKSK